MRICVVGGGIIGLSTGLYLARRAANAGAGAAGGLATVRDRHTELVISDCVDPPSSPSESELDRRMEVTVLTDRTTPETTADGAAGIWGPYLITDTPVDDQRRWAQATHDLIESIWNTEGGGADLGLSLQSAIRLNPSDSACASWKDVVYGFRRMTRAELDTYGRLTGRHKNGAEFVTYTIEPIKLLPVMLKEFRALGGRLVLTPGARKVTDLARVATEGGFDLVVNCTGVWAGQLAGDDKVRPYRGQVMRLRAPWLKRTVLDDEDDGNYVISNQDSVVYGGTHQNDWETRPSEKDATFIRDGCAKLMAADAKGAEHIRDWVGLRPGRPSVRLERERLSDRRHPGSTVEVIHNYGHGGSGITIFWGCAKDAYRLAAEVHRELQQNRKRRGRMAARL